MNLIQNNRALHPDEKIEETLIKEIEEENGCLDIPLVKIMFYIAQ